MTESKGFERFPVVGLALDPIHVGTGGARLGRVDQSIVRDPVTRLPKIPGSSLAGVCRAYAAMAQGKYPVCAGQGQPDRDGHGGHCSKADCPICTVFGFARGDRGGFAGLAAFSDAQLLFFPVATREGPVWVTSPGALRSVSHEITEKLDDAMYRVAASPSPLNLGWLLLDVKALPSFAGVRSKLEGLGIPEYIRQDRIGIVSDKVFGHVVNSNLEVRTSVSIDPDTGAAEEGKLFSYEALPRGTVLVWDVTCRQPRHFKVGTSVVEAVRDARQVFAVVETAHPYIEHLGIGGMGTRGMGRLRVLSQPNDAAPVGGP